MTIDQFEHFLDSRKDFIEWREDEENFYFRDLRYSYFCENQDNCIKVAKTLFKNMSPEQLEKEIIRGLRVEHITRVTGYFAKVNGWNPGKRGELSDRYRGI